MREILFRGKRLDNGEMIEGDLRHGGYMATTGDAWDWVDCEEIEVIGNIHDNPEQLEEENHE